MVNKNMPATEYRPGRVQVGAHPLETLAAWGAPPPPVLPVDRLTYDSPGRPPWAATVESRGRRRKDPLWARAMVATGLTLIVAAGVVYGLALTRL